MKENLGKYTYWPKINRGYFTTRSTKCEVRYYEFYCAAGNFNGIVVCVRNWALGYFR